MKTIEDVCYGRTDLYEIRTEWPAGMKVWNIDFRFQRYIPLCYVNADYHVDLKRLVAFYVPDKGLRKEVMKAAGRTMVNENVFNQIKEKYYGNKAN